MKKVLFATTALVLSAGYAAAEVSVSGDGRMGMVYNGEDVNFTSRARVKFTLTGESDSGLSFGGDFRVDHEDEDGGSASRGAAGTVYVSGTYGKLTMGDIDSAAEKAVGDLHGVGLTGLGDANELTYLTSGLETNDNPGALYEYTTGALTVYASMNDGVDDLSALFGVAPDGEGDSAWSVGAAYDAGSYKAGLGYESLEVNGVDVDHWAVSGEGSFGATTVKAAYGEASDLDFTQYGLSAMYDAGAVDVTGFWMRNEIAGADLDAMGVGAAYDLGGGASLKGGIVNLDDGVDSDTIADIGLAFTF